MLEDLLKSRRIYKQEVSSEDIKMILQRAEHDLKIAQKIMPEDWGWVFVVAYNAVLQASRAFMFSKGYRPASFEGHKNTFLFMKTAMGSEHEVLITYFDRMRIKRHQAVYDISGVITETEARSFFKKAEDYVALIREKIGEKTDASSADEGVMFHIII